MPVMIFLSFLLLLLFPKEISGSISDVTALCTHTLIPAMFPYFVLSDLFVSLGYAESLGRKLKPCMEKLFHVSGCGVVPLLIGLTGGYPLGAKTVSQLYKNGDLSLQDANKLLTFCCNAGPAFTIGVIGSAVYGSAMIGVILFVIQIVSALLVGLLPCFRSSAGADTSLPVGKKHAAFSALVGSVTASVSVTGKVCAFILFFSVFITLEKMLFGVQSVLFPIISAVTELSAGSVFLAASTLPWPLKFSITSAGIAFGGACVLCQTAAVLGETKLSLRPYLWGKGVQSFLSAILALPVSFFLHPAETAGNFPVQILPFQPNFWAALPLLFLFLLFLQFPSSNFKRSPL